MRCVPVEIWISSYILFSTIITMAIFFTRDNFVLAFPLLAVCTTYVSVAVSLLFFLFGGDSHSYSPQCCARSYMFFFLSGPTGIFQVCSTAVWSASAVSSSWELVNALLNVLNVGLICHNSFISQL